jgi:hypothetical protein
MYILLHCFEHEYEAYKNNFIFLKNNINLLKIGKYKMSESTILITG